MTSRSLRLAIVSISVGAVERARLLGGGGEDLDDVGRQRPEADRLDLDAGRLGGVEERPARRCRRAGTCGR